MKAIRAYFSDGVTAKAAPVVLNFDGAHLLIQSEATGALLASWPIDSITAHSSFAVQTSLFSKVAPDSELQLPTENFVESVRPRLKSKRWGESFVGVRHRNKKLLILSGFCLVFLASLILGLRLVTRSVVEAIPLALEKRLFHRSLLEIPGVTTCSAPKAVAFLNGLAEELSSESERAERLLEIRVLNLKLPNAFAYLGGQIYFTSAFLEQAESVDEIAGVMAHEMEHISQRHVLNHLVQNYGFQALLGPLSGRGTLDPSTLSVLVQLQYSRTDETSADAGAGRRLDKSPYSRQGLASFLKRADKKEGKAPFRLDLLSSHPITADRIDALLQLVRDKRKKLPPLSKEILKILRHPCETT